MTARRTTPDDDRTDERYDRPLIERRMAKYDRSGSRTQKQKRETFRKLMRPQPY